MQRASDLDFLALSLLGHAEGLATLDHVRARLDKVLKLLRLAESPEPHEASVALARAQQLARTSWAEGAETIIARLQVMIAATRDPGARPPLGARSRADRGPSQRPRAPRRAQATGPQPDREPASASRGSSPPRDRASPGGAHGANAGTGRASAPGRAGQTRARSPTGTTRTRSRSASAARDARQTDHGSARPHWDRVCEADLRGACTVSGPPPTRPWATADAGVRGWSFMAGWLAADRAASILSEQPSPREDRRVRPGEARMFTVLAGTKSDCGWNVRLYQVLCVTLGCALHERFKTRQFVLHGPAHARTLVSTAGHQIEGLVMALVRARHKSGYGARGASRQTAYGLVDGLLYRYLQAIDAGGLARLEVGHRPAPIPAALRDRAGRPFPTKRHRVTTRAMYDAGLWAGLCAVSSVTVARALERGLALAAKG